MDVANVEKKLKFYLEVSEVVLGTRIVFLVPCRDDYYTIHAADGPPTPSELREPSILRFSGGIWTSESIQIHQEF